MSRMLRAGGWLIRMGWLGEQVACDRDRRDSVGQSGGGEGVGVSLLVLGEAGSVWICTRRSGRGGALLVVQSHARSILKVQHIGRWAIVGLQRYRR